jgi:hypothetical protein
MPSEEGMKTTQICNPPDNTHLQLYHSLLLDNGIGDDEDDLNPKLNNLHTDYLEESQSVSFVRLMF